MMKPDKDRSAIIHTRFSPRLKRAILREAGESQVSLRAILEASVRDRYDPERTASHWQSVTRELKTMRREIAHVSAGNTVLLESLALLVKNLFSSLAPPTAEGRLAGDAFYARFMDAVVSAIESDRILIKRVLALAIAQHDGGTRNQPVTEARVDD